MLTWLARDELLHVLHLPIESAVTQDFENTLSNAVRSCTAQTLHDISAVAVLSL